MPGEVGRVTAATSAIFDFEITNENVGVSIVTTQSRMQLTLPDGTVVEGRDIAREGIPAASTVQGRYAFEVPEGTEFDGLVLAMADAGREPSFDVPFTGPAPEVETAVVLEPDKSAPIPMPGVEMTWTIETLTLARDWPAPFGFRGGSRLASTR